jgi:iron uptake system EfeUOB component EfeO/EfeM
MRRLIVLLVTGPCLLLGLAACNDGEVAKVQGTTVSLTLSDYRIVPQRVRVEPGRITFLVRNDGHGAHNWQVRGRGKVRGRIATLLPGASGRLTVRLRRGTYRMSCGIGHHEELGEYGTLSVR